MGPEVPPGFLDVYTASSKRTTGVNVIGLVSDFLPASRSRGSDWMLTFSIADQTYGCPGDQGNEGLKIRVFSKTPDAMPEVSGIGDIVLMRNLKITEWNGMVMAMTHYSSTWTVFPASTIPEALSSSPSQIPSKKGRHSRTHTAIEVDYAISLCNSFNRALFTGAVTAPNAVQVQQANSSKSLPSDGRRDKFCLVKDMNINTYHDAVAQVVKLFPWDGRVDLYVSDYSAHQALFFYKWGDEESNSGPREGDQFGYAPKRSDKEKKWPGPFGKLTLPVTLWPPHSYFAQDNIREGDFVFLRNLHIRLDNENKMVASLHSDRRVPDRIDVTKIIKPNDDKRVQDLRTRKEEYHVKFDGESKSSVKEVKIASEAVPEDGKPLTKNQKRRRKRQEEKKGVQTNRDGRTDEPKAKRQRIDGDGRPSEATAAANLNPNVRCSNHLTPITSLSKTNSFSFHGNKTPKGAEYTLPFQNIRTRARVRVVDFFPPNLADFAVPVEPKNKKGTTGNQPDTDNEADSTSLSAPRRWEWRFALHLSDAHPSAITQSTKSELKAPATIKAYVSASDAEFLLKVDACDLRRSPGALAQLREKLFLLWGDLEERKASEKQQQTGSAGTESTWEKGGKEVVDSQSGRSRSALSEIDGNRGSSNSQDVKPDLSLKDKRKPFECCLQEYGIKVLQQSTATGQQKKKPRGDHQQSTRGEEGTEDDSEEEDPRDPTTLGIVDHVAENSGWRWERRWRMFGCIID